MANLFSSLFKQIEKAQSVHPPSASPAFSRYDCEYIEYCIEQEQTMHQWSFVSKTLTIGKRIQSTIF